MSIQQGEWEIGKKQCANIYYAFINMLKWGRNKIWKIMVDQIRAVCVENCILFFKSLALTSGTGAKDTVVLLAE